jgi:hypothetical protein
LSFSAAEDDGVPTNPSLEPSIPLVDAWQHGLADVCCLGGSLKSEFPGFLRSSPAFFYFFDGFSQLIVDTHDS